MMSFIDDLEKRLNLVFAEDFTLDEASIESPEQPWVIDMGNRTDRLNALENSRGPYIGWGDYAAGNDYQPPMHAHSSVPMGPPDENGNPHSEKYGGVRPWSKEEIIQTVIEPGGMADKMSRGTDLLRAYTKNGTDQQKVEALKTNAAIAVQYKLRNDEAREGVRFQSWLMWKLRSAMGKGMGAQYGNENNVAQGMLTYWNELIGAAVRPIRQGRDTSHLVSSVMYGGYNKRKQKLLYRPGYLSIDEENPGEWNDLGDLAVPVYNMGEQVVNAINSGDLDQVNRVRRDLLKLKFDMDKAFNSGKVLGALTDVTAPSKAGGFGATSFQVAGGDAGKEMERTDIVDRLEQAQAKTAEQVKDPSLMKRIVTMTNTGIWTPAQEAVNAMAYLKSILSSPVKKEDFAIQEREDDGQIVYDVLSPNGALIQSSRNSVEAQEILDKITPSSVMADDISDFAETLGMQYGKYLEPFKRALDALSQGLKSGDNKTAQQGLNLLGDLKPQAEAEVQQERQKTSKKAKPGDLNKPSVISRKLSATEYRYLLRWYNIKNYPERGTENDPEMINGEPSNWKQAGYPEFTKHKKTSIARDLGFGKQRGGMVYKAAVAKMQSVVQAAYGDMGIQLEGVSPNHIILKECIDTITRELVRYFITDD